MDGALEAPPPPDGFEGVHSLLRRASQLGVRAAALRRMDPEVTTPAAREAAAAAAGALMLFAHAGDQLERLLAYPELP